jgi:ankyrin repeat protein
VLLKNWEMFNWTLSQGVDINDRDEQGRTLFSLLLGLGAPIETLEELIYRGADPRVPDFKKRTVVHQAISTNNAPALNFLLDRVKLDVNAQDAEGNTALHYAVSLGNMAATWRILETWGGDVNASNKNGINALHLVCNHVNITDRPTIPILVLLFRYNIEKELRSLIDGNTPLHVCAMNGHKPLVTAITKFVHNTATSNYQGYTPAMLAALNGHGDLGRELYKRSEAPVQQWNEAQLGEYIFFEFPFLKASRRLDLMHRFFVYRIDGSQLPQVSNDILAGMGINDPQYRELLLKIFEKLLNEGPAIFNPTPAATQEKPEATTEQLQEQVPQQPDLARDVTNLRERVQPIEL